MTATTLTKIDKAFEELTSGQLDGKLIPKSKYDDLVQQSTRNLGGHRVLDKEELARRAVAHVNKIANYANARAKLIQDLKKAGITALATLPVDAWNTICKETKLLQFSPGGGLVYFNDNACRNEHDGEVMVATAITIVSVLATILAVAFFTAFNDYNGASQVFGVFAARAVVPVVFYIIYESATWGSYRFWTTALVKRKLKTYEGISKYVNSDGNGSSTQLVLPPAPANVQEIMLKAAPYQYMIHVAAVAEAVAFAPNLNNIYAKNSETALKAYWAEQARIRAMARDPINYVVKDGVVAIIAQYGDFPIEQALVDRLVKEEVVELPYTV